MIHQQKAVIYLDWVNNFLTVEGFASYYGISIENASKLIEEGRTIHEQSLTKELTWE